MDIHFIRENPEYCKENQKKRFLDPNVVDKIIEIDENWRTKIDEGNNLRAIKNRLSKLFKTAPKDSTHEFEIDQLVKSVKTHFQI